MIMLVPFAIFSSLLCSNVQAQPLVADFDFIPPPPGSAFHSYGTTLTFMSSEGKSFGNDGVLAMNESTPMVPSWQVLAELVSRLNETVRFTGKEIKAQGSRCSVLPVGDNDVYSVLNLPSGGIDVIAKTQAPFIPQTQNNIVATEIRNRVEGLTGACVIWSQSVLAVSLTGNYSLSKVSRTQHHSILKS
jgi:hypothetical protein